MRAFQDKNGFEWQLILTFDKVEKVERFVKDKDGKPVSIFAMTESGDFSPIKDLKTLTKVGFFILLEDILAVFDLQNFDAENEALYEFFPELKIETKIQKAARFFSSLLDGPSLEALNEALMEEIVNFTLNPLRQQAMREILAKEKELEAMTVQKACQKILSKLDNMEPTIENELNKGLDQYFPQAQQNE